MKLCRTSLLGVATCALVSHAHTVITYPGWRGNNLGIDNAFPYGMQWSYPCGGLPLSTNRTKWPITGGAVAIQPGWFTGHKTSLFYINLGVGTTGPDGGPPNMSFPMVSAFEIVGPSDGPYPGTFCLPQIPLPANLTVKPGDNATIQVVETAKHGGAFYNCVDITFSSPEDAPEVNATNCFNSTDISFQKVEYLNLTQSTDDEPSTNPSTNSTATSCPPCTASQTTAACPPQTSCPKANGNPGMTLKEGFGVGLPLGVLALGIFGL